MGRKQASINIDLGILNLAKQKAKDLGVSRSRAIEMALAESYGIPVPGYSPPLGSRVPSPRPAVEAPAPPAEPVPPKKKAAEDLDDDLDAPDPEPKKAKAKASADDDDDLD